MDTSRSVELPRPEPSSAEPAGLAGPARGALPPGLGARLGELFPGARITAVHRLGVDEAEGEGRHESTKELGYGEVIRVTLEAAEGTRTVVLHTAKPNDFGHDRRSDRAAEALLAWDTFPRVPRQVPALDVGAVRRDGTLVSLADAGELYLLTEWRDGTLYANDLRRVAEAGELAPGDVARARALGAYLAEVHAAPGSHPEAYVRAIRDLVGHGECVAGLADSYPDGVPMAPRERLERLERACLEWRFRLRRRVHRLRRTHGDFHPFNVLFTDEGTSLAVLDTSRGSEGEPADDVACLAINYLFFGLALPLPRFERTFARLWDAFFEGYGAADDDELFAVLAPFFAFRALVLASPLWYPELPASERDRVHGFAERALASPRVERDAWRWAFEPWSPSGS